MRDILFRGKRKSDGKWIYGMFVAENYDADFTCIIPEYDTVDHESADWHVGLQTVGQYTGLVDKNGTKIFEGDILQSQYDDPPEPPTLELVVWDTTAWCQQQPGYAPEPMVYDDFFLTTTEVVGNIHDNPELLEGGGE